MRALCDAPVILPDHREEKNTDSHCLFEVLSGPSVTLWMAGDPGQDTKKDLQLKIAPDRPVIIGRAEGSGIPYLDPAYSSTTILFGRQWKGRNC